MWEDFGWPYSGSEPVSIWRPLVQTKPSALVTIAIFKLLITPIDLITTLGKTICYISRPPACKVEIRVKK